MGMQAKRKQWDDTLAKVAAMATAGQKSRKRLTDMARAKKPGEELISEYQVRLGMPLLQGPSSCGWFVRRYVVCMHAWVPWGVTHAVRDWLLDRRRWRVC
jgi:hypothetical protein